MLFAVFFVIVFGATGFLPLWAQEDDRLSLSENLQDLNVRGHIHSVASRLEQDGPGGSDDTTALDVNSVELSLTNAPVRAVDANVTFLLEEELDGGTPDDGFAVDQAYVVLAGNHRPLVDRRKRRGFDVNPWYLKVGKFYVPFGTKMDYHTFDVVSEPQTLALAETLESQVQLGYTPRDGLDAYAGVFSGAGGDSEAGRARDNELDDAYAGVDLNLDSLSLSVQWMNNLNNSIALVDEAGTEASSVGGVSLYGTFTRGNVTLQAAHVRALDEYRTGGLGVGSEPTATSFEATYRNITDLFDRPLTGTIVYERTDEWAGHPENVHGLVLDLPVVSGVKGSLQYLERDYDSSSTVRDEQLVSARLAVGFEEFFGGGADE